MKNHTHAGSNSSRRLTIRRVAALGLGLGFAFLAGCSDKPPACSDPEVVKMITDDVMAQTRAFHVSETPPKREILDWYYQHMKLSLEQITTEGYDKEAKRHSCQATINVSAPRDRHSPVAFRYTVQSVEGKSGEFLVRTADQLRYVAPGIAGDATDFVREVQSGEFKLDQADGSKATGTVVQPAPPAAVPDGSVRADPEPVAAPSSSVPVALPTAEPAAPSVAPSFSCAAKLSSTEKLICETPPLAQADANLGRLYAIALGTTADAAALKQQQRDWRKGRDTCADTACVAAAYEKRLVELSR